MHLAGDQHNRTADTTTSFSSSSSHSHPIPTPVIPLYNLKAHARNLESSPHTINDRNAVGDPASVKLTPSATSALPLLLATQTMSGKQALAQARDLKHRVLTCLHKLSDRDTHAAAASELEIIARTLSGDALPSFISSISATDSSDKSPVRRQCVRLLAVLSEHHGNSLSPHLSKVLSAVVRRLRDPDSSVRSACVAASLSLSSQLTSPPFASITKPFVESLFTEQDSNTQNGAALCLAAVVEGSRAPDAGSLRKLMPRLEKLAKCESFKAKAAILALMGSVVGVKGVLGGGGKNAMKNLIACLMEFLSSEDWAARKAAAEALLKIAAVERDALSEFKASCLKTFEAKRFDKVKAARETMNQMVEAWKEIPDLTDEVSPTPESQAASKEHSRSIPQVKKSSPLDEHGSRGRRSCVGGNGNRTSPPMFRKLDRIKPTNINVVDMAEDTPLDGDGDEEKRFENPKMRRALFNAEEASVAVTTETGDIISEDLSLIRNQLVQIQNQQSNLLDILQRFIGSSQNGIHALEARVHGLELALDEISFDLSVSTRRMPATSCCSLPVPGASKLRRKTETPSQLPSEGFPLQNHHRRQRLHGGRGIIVNPLAEIPTQVSFNGVV